MADENGNEVNEQSKEDLKALIKEIIKEVMSETQDADEENVSKKVLDEDKDDDKDEDKDKDAEDEDNEAEVKKANAMDAQIKKLSAQVSALEKNGVKAIFAKVASRDKLAKSLEPHIGVFDHSQMDATEVAVYGAKKLGLQAPKGQEEAMLAGWLTARESIQQVRFVGDARTQEANSVDSFLKELGE